MPSDRPIIFSAPMVRALLDGRKTQTRRLATSPLKRCEVGDRLWVRESFAAEELSLPPQKVKATARERKLSGRTDLIACDELDGADGVRFSADDTWQRIQNTPEAGEAWSVAFHYRLKGGQRPSGLRGLEVPSIHMPRWASRLTLIVEGVRVQPLHDISETDAIAEGIRSIPHSDGPNFYTVDIDHGALSEGSAARTYQLLWSVLHGEQSWHDNPDVVALTFRVVRGNIDQVPA